MSDKSQNGNHPLNNTLQNLKDFKEELENHVIILDSGRGVSLSNLPTHFWETIGECINDIEHHITTKQEEDTLVLNGRIYPTELKLEWYQKLLGAFKNRRY